MNFDWLIWLGVAFLSGSVPYSPLVGRLALGKNIREYGDGNPGGTNVFRAGGKGAGLVAILLDGFKGAIPVAVAYWGLGIQDWRLVLIALAPVLGHAFSPLLKFQGGKAVATTFGIWAGLTGPEAPIVLGGLLGVFFLTLNLSGWAMLATMLGFGLHLLTYRPDPIFLTIWALNTMLIVWKYRADLLQRPALKTDLARKFLQRVPLSQRETT